MRGLSQREKRKVKRVEQCVLSKESSRQSRNIRLIQFNGGKNSGLGINLDLCSDSGGGHGQGGGTRQEATDADQVRGVVAWTRAVE